MLNRKEMAAKKIVIFGINDTAELADFYIENDTESEVIAFTVDKEYINDKTTFRGRPLIPFEEIENHYLPSDIMMFAPMTGSNMNKDRERVYNKIKDKGYAMYTYVSSKATVCNNEIGDNCFILEDNTLQPFTKIGNNVVMWSGNHIGHHGEIKDHVFFTSHVVLSGHCLVESYSWFGVNATVRDYSHIAEGTLVAMSACITKNTEPWGVYMGIPAKKLSKPSNEVG